ncbi:unnamed protein product [Durusdinium trenchii]|uniref:Uncharacterized protein n=1 Tax=Durusdinium trenchii TaxID=1381693 RepID=A0ABP0QIC8_9DINO
MPQTPHRTISTQRALDRPDIGATTLQREHALPLMGENAESVKRAVVPDAIGVTLGLQLQETADMAAYQILKPLFLTDLPLPWEVRRREHGRYDFYHAAVREYRQEHPMLGFFKDVLEFLRTNAKTGIPMDELLEAQVFKEASPEVVRYRLGIWEGPVEDSSGSLVFVRQWLGRDDACVKTDQRYDDPRFEAAANISFRLGGWMHLWRGFVGQEPFPFLEGRLGALCQQLGESVVTAPGMATTQMIAHMEQLLPRLEPPEPPPEPEKWVMTSEEEAMQPLVTDILAKAYSSAISEAARREKQAMMHDGRLAGDSDRFAARVTCKLIYQASQRLVADLEHQDWAALHFPPEEEEEHEYSDDLAEDPFEEDDEEEDQTSEEAVEDLGERHVEDPEQLEDEEEYSQHDPEDVIALVDDPEVEVEETDDVRPVIQVCKGFIASLESDHAAWARRQLRPWTPPSRRQSTEEAASPKALWPDSPKVETHRPRLGRKQRVWRQTGFQEEGQELQDDEEVDETSPTDQVAQALLAHAMAFREAGGISPEVAIAAKALLEHAMAGGVSPQSEGLETLPMTQSLDSQAEAAVAEAALAEDDAHRDNEEVEETDMQRVQEDSQELPVENQEENPVEGGEGEEGNQGEELSPVPETTKPSRSESYWPLLDMQLKPELQEKVDSFARRLEEATSTFNHCTGDDGSYDVDDFLCSVSWNWSTSEPERSESYRTGRAFLARASIHDPMSLQLDGSEMDEYQMVAQGCAARPPSPKRGKMRRPWYMEDAAEPPEGLAAGQPAFPLERARSSSPRLVRKSKQTPKLQAATMRMTRRGIGKPPPKAKLEPRPPSAGCYTRPRHDELVPFQPCAAALEAAKSTKRFLSRTCGTMQAALATFDPSGDGRFSREEWDLGLKQLDFTVNYDHQEIFTVLDKRLHHMLTLSDLLDYCSGIPIDTGMPAPGLRGTMSELFEEVMEEQLAKAVQEALGEVALQGLQNPSGPTSSLPDVQGYVRHLKLKKQREKEASQANQAAPSSQVSGKKKRSSATGSGETNEREDDSYSEETEPELPQQPGQEEPVSTGKEPGSRHQTQQERKEARAAKAAAKSAGRTLSPSLSREGSAGRAPTPQERKEARAAKAAAKAAGKALSPPGSPQSREGSAGRAQTPQERKEARAANAAAKAAGRARTPPSSREADDSPKDEAAKKKHAKKKHKAEDGTSTEQGNSPKTRTSSPGKLKQQDSSPHPENSVAFASALTRNFVEVDPNINPNEEITRAKKKLRKKKVRRAGSSDSKKRVRSHSPERSYLAVRNQPQPIAKFLGYSFVDREDFGKDVPDSQLLPYVPRPASDICKTYGHVFRILGDPRVRRLKVEPKEKRSVHEVFMPRPPSCFEPDSDGPTAGDTFNAEKAEGQAVAMPVSKSTPDLRTTQASTTAGTWRSSFGSDTGERSDRVSLPPLVQSQNQRPELYMGIAPGSICSGTEERALCQIDSIKYISSRIDSGIFKVVPTH